MAAQHQHKKSVYFAMMRSFLLVLMGSFSLQIYAQGGGNGVFTLPKQASNARQLAWTGSNVSYANRDITSSLNNPALINKTALMRPAMNINSQVPGVWSGNAGMGFAYKDWMFSGQFMYIDFGSFDAYDAGGNAQGTTNANETLFGITGAKEITDRLTLGVSAKMSYQVLGPYIGNAVMFDAGALYKSKDSTWTLGGSIRNAGFMLTRFNESEKTPLDIQIGMTIKPKHMPFRFNLTFHDLQQRDLTYSQYLESNNLFDASGNGFEEEASFGEKVMRHFTFGGELVLGKNFSFLMGYNHQRRMELAPEQRKGVTGMGWGLEFKMSKFNITYGSAALFPGFNMNMFTFSAAIDDFKRK